ncbi:MAG: hypothetical protein GQ540_03355 [Lutibacter sp.]|uniref:hypothetical protein n=1 Tax=Lutibacter sp. TaxID=1925666 RepID=UPI0019E47FD2|nr:hypothetical protein [Lutibacter sp.]NOR27549.1 hypothetical protein [Lutibacter sp.]
MKIFSHIIGTIAFLFFMYGIYWVGKTISYNIFYKDMVRGTVIEMVNPEYLKIEDE